MSAKISQKDYLKKYLSSDKSTDKKKKKKKSKTLIGQSVKIIDDDIDFSKLHQIADEDLEVYAIGEDAPQIVGVFDERPPELIAKEDYKNNGKWKVIADDDGFTSSLNIQFTDSDGKVSKSAKNDFRKKSRDNADDDLSPPRIQVRINENNSSYNSLQKNSKIHKRVEEPKSSRFTDASPQRRSKCGSDESPPRRNAPVDNKTSTSNLAPRRHRRNSIDDSSTFRKHSDSSPKIKIKQEPDSDVSPPRRRRSSKNSDSDQSPPRILKNYSSSTLGKKVKVERDSLCSSVRPRYSENRGYTHLDKSPPRKFRGRSSSGPLGRQIKQEYDSDVPSVSRKRSRSPSRRGYAGSGSSKPRMDRRFSKSPSNHRRRSPYKHRDNRSPSVERRVRSSSIEGNNQNIRKTLDLKTAGLQNAKALRIENEKSKQREEEVFKKMSTDMSGRNAEAVVRDRKTGRIRDLGEEAAREHEKLMKEQEKKAVYDKWGKGLKQVEDYRSRLQNDLLEINKPLARYSDDKDLEEMLKKQERDGDPMLNYIRNKVESRSDATPSKPIYRGAYPENRFGIRPGYRWDGVDRSNGYETKWFDMQSKQKAGEEEAYKYSTEDM